MGGAFEVHHSLSPSHSVTWLRASPTLVQTKQEVGEASHGGDVDLNVQLPDSDLSKDVVGLGLDPSTV